MLAVKSKISGFIALVLGFVALILDKLFNSTLAIPVLSFGSSWISSLMTLIISLMPLIIMVYLLKILKEQLKKA